KRTTTVQRTDGHLALPEARGAPARVLVSGVGTTAYVAWPDGRLLHVDVRRPEAPRVVEDLDLVPESDRTLTSLAFLIGRTTLAAGDSRGGLRAWFPARAEQGGDGAPRLTMAHALGQPTGAAV